MINTLYTHTLGIEAIPSAPIFDHIHHRKTLRPWVKFAIRNTIWAVATVAICGFGYYARFCM
jgi:aspartate carbamoyltransferase regulatory subunit